MTDPVDRGVVADAIARVRDDIAQRTVRPVTLVAVTKGFGVDAVEAALAGGADAVGENYAQELLAKQDALAVPVPWHFIGRLQRNKVRNLAPFVRCWQSIDRVEVAVEVGRRAPGAAVLVEVDVAGDAAKGGCAPDAVPGIVRAALDAGLDVRGLMTIGVAGDVARTRAAFARLSVLADRLELVERSMGMSDDYGVAVEEGATIVRIGRRLFGPRPHRG
jgi:pyridoxal phosphate enzyme (YggS family)